MQNGNNIERTEGKKKWKRSDRRMSQVTKEQRSQTNAVVACIEVDQFFFARSQANKEDVRLWCGIYSVMTHFWCVLFPIFNSKCTMVSFANAQLNIGCNDQRPMMMMIMMTTTTIQLIFHNQLLCLAIYTLYIAFERNTLFDLF